MSVPAQRMFPSPKISAYFYGYSAAILATNDGVSATQNINIQADSNFLVQQMMFACLNGAAMVAQPKLFLQITDASSGMTLFDRALPIWLVAGTPQLPFQLPTPRTFPASSSIQVAITNNDGGARDLYLMFAGQKVARLGG